MNTPAQINAMTRLELTACYVENIGYDPFYKSDITESEVAAILNEYFAEIKAEQDRANKL